MFGKRLAELRNSKEISQYELASQMNLSRGQIANYEQGTREPDFATLIALADYFEVSLDSLLGRDKLSNVELDNIAFFSGDKEKLTAEEADFLKESLILLRKYESRLKD
ncbi:HTH-type transcriptional regulator Xre [compost metagenome]